MAKYKDYDYSQKLFIPVSLEDQLMPGTLEFAIHTLIETRMDMSVFDMEIIKMTRQVARHMIPRFF